MEAVPSFLILCVLVFLHCCPSCGTKHLDYQMMADLSRWRQGGVAECIDYDRRMCARVPHYPRFLQVLI